MSGKPIDIQHNHKITTGAEVPAGYVGLFAKADGLYEKLPGEGGAERKLYNEGGAGGGMFIPTLKLQHGHFRAAGDPAPRRDELYASWDSADESFLDYSPEIWVFRRRNNARRKLVSESLADELCIDPGCDDPGAWTLNAGITVADSAIKFQNVEQGESIYMSLFAGQAWPWAWYEITFTVSNYSGGAIKAFYGDSFTDLITSNGTYTIRIRREAPPAAFGYMAFGLSTSLHIDDVSFKRVIRLFDSSLKKKWAHEPHLNGVKYPNSAFWAGETKCEIASIQATGRQTEFELTAAKREKQLIAIDPYEYFFGYEIATSQFIKLSDSTPASSISNFKAAGTTNLSIGFRFAIVIDHPAIEGAKLIGDLSDPVYLRLQKAYDRWGIALESFALRYRANQIILR